MALLEVEDLTVQFYTEDGVVRAVDGVSYEIEAGETFGIVGESGAGKSVTSLALLRLIDRPGEIVRGEIRFRGRDVRSLSDDELRSLRGNDVAIAFQNPEAALNPVYTVGEQIAEAVRAHDVATGEAARERAIDLLERVGIPDAAIRYSDYPHEFSGGMAQRVVVAMALSCDPDLLVLDEPTTGLDVTVQAQLLELLDELASASETAIQLVTHDLGVVAERCDRAMVLYAGRAVERGPVEELFYDPGHPYTAGLLASLPRIGDDRDRLPTIPGSTPDLVHPPTGCRFHPRCPYAEEACATRDPELVDVETGAAADEGAERNHVAACHAHTGELDGELGYGVVVEDGSPSSNDAESDGDETASNAVEADGERGDATANPNGGEERR